MYISANFLEDEGMVYPYRTILKFDESTNRVFFIDKTGITLENPYMQEFKERYIEWLVNH